MGIIKETSGHLGVEYIRRRREKGVERKKKKKKGRI